MIDRLIKMFINDTEYNVKGTNIKVVNDSIFVNGELVSKGNVGTVHIKWEGPVANIDCTSLEVVGDVNGDVDCTSLQVGGNVTGDVDATSVKVTGDINGNVDATSLTCKGISGKVKM